MKKTLDNINGDPIYFHLSPRKSGPDRLAFYVKGEGENWTDVTKRVWKAPFAKEWCESHDQHGEAPHIHGFWGYYNWLSNFYLKAITVPEGEFWSSNYDFPSVEHAYQFAKLPLVEQQLQYDKILGYTPGQVKIWGQGIQLREGWSELREPVMKIAVSCKFLQNQIIRERLLATNDAELVETNWWGDIFFGVDPTAVEHGKNILGKSLMAVRDVIRSNT